jgi:curved DNA-binding protein CbpA
MTTINWYDVLLVEPDCTVSDIKNAYRELVKIYHPDKKEGDAEMFKLITHAYTVLVNPQSRASYDKLYDISKHAESDHVDLKKKSEQYFQSLENTTVKKTREEVDIDFDTIFAEMDLKYGLQRDGNKKLIHKETGNLKQKMEDLESIRGQDDIENIPDKLFEDIEHVDPLKFNSMFDMMYKKHTDLIKHEGNPIAYNTLNEYGAFSSIDNYEVLFAEDDDLGNSLFGSVKISEGNVPKKINKKELDKSSHYADYVTAHNYKDEHHAKTLEEKIKERNMETTRYESRDMSEFDNNDDCGGYGIFKGVGINFDEFKNGGLLDDGVDLKKQYNKMLGMRRETK